MQHVCWKIFKEEKEERWHELSFIFTCADVRSIVKAVNVVFPWRQAFKDVIVQALPQSEVQTKQVT